MKWVGISGSWRATNKEVETDVRREAADIIKAGNGIVSGGALNVDSFALGEAMRLNPDCSQIKIFIPTSLETYDKHYHKRAEEGVITNEQADKLIAQLRKLKNTNPKSLIENPKNTVVDKTTYFQRNMAVVEASNELLAFQVNDSEGVTDTILKAKEKNIPVKLFKYKIKIIED